MNYVFHFRSTIIPFIFIILLLFSCKKDSDINPSDQFMGTYTGEARFIKDDLLIDAQNNAFISFEKGTNDNELRITASSLNIVQNTITLSGNNFTLPKKAILGNLTYEEGRGRFEGNTLLFEYIQTSEQSVNGRILMTLCNLKKI